MTVENIDPELLDFAARVLEHHGAATDIKENYLDGVLPVDLAKILGTGEEIRLGNGGEKLLYGSPILDRLVDLGTQDVPVVYGKLHVPYLKRAGFERLFKDEIHFVNTSVQLVNRAEARTTYILLVCHYVALSDERKEGIIEVSVNESSRAVIESFKDLWAEFNPVFFEPGHIPPHFPARIDKVIQHGLEVAEQDMKRELAPFLESMERRLRRDIISTVEYYESVYKEMESSLKKPNVSAIQREERLEKMKGIHGELDRKIVDLKKKYRVHVTLTARAAIRLLVPIVQLQLRVRYRKDTKDIRIIWNPVTRSLDPIVCEKCGKNTRQVYFTRDGAFKPFCFKCITDR